MTRKSNTAPKAEPKGQTEITAPLSPSKRVGYNPEDVRRLLGDQRKGVPFPLRPRSKAQRQYFGASDHSFPP
jgi:hypothetical protein